MQLNGQQPDVNAAIPSLCQKVVATFNRLLCAQGKVRFGQLRVEKDGFCVNFGLLGRCPGQARSVYRAQQPAGSNSQSHGEFDGNYEGRSRVLTG